VISNDGRGGEVSQTIVLLDVNEKPVILTDGNNTSLMFSIRIRSYGNFGES
jgi:hypothetical protein